jgi:hypothetical protein
MRLIQEYETIKGLLVTAELAKTLGLPALEKAMSDVREKFGKETVSIALDVTLKVGMRREKSAVRHVKRPLHQHGYEQ